MSTGASPRRSLLGFHALLLALSVPSWLVGAVTGIQFPARLPLSSLIAVCLALAALILAYGKPDPRANKPVEASLRSHQDQAIWYLPSMLLMPAIAVLAYWVMRLTGRRC